MINGVQPAVVYLAPQAIAPLSPSTEAIALTLAHRPDLVQQSRAAAPAAVHEQPEVTGPASVPGHVDVYA